MISSEQSCALIVAKYNEDLSWLSAVNGSFKKYIYSKLGNDPAPNFVSLPNIGREAHTYLWHIVHNYEKLEDWLVFTQGNPLDHCPDFAAQINALKGVDGFLPIGGELIVFNRWARPHLDGSGPGKHERSLGAFFEYLLSYPCPLLLICRSRALFAVSRQRVRSRSLAFYQKSLETLTDEATAPSPAWSLQHPLEAHFFERLWHRIFAPAGLETATFEEQLESFCGRDVLSVCHGILQKWQEAAEKSSAGEEMVWLMTMNKLVQRFDLAQ